MENEEVDNKFPIEAIIVLVILLIALGVRFMFHSIENAEKEKNYNQGITYLKHYDYKNAAKKLSVFQYSENNDNPKYKNARILYLYVEAMNTTSDNRYQIEEAYQMAEDQYLSKIPNDYTGEFAKDIKVIKAGVEEVLAECKEAHKKNIKYREKHIYIGDPADKVIRVLGKPEEINKTVASGLEEEQWVYGNRRYVYLENGSVVSWQESQ